MIKIDIDSIRDIIDSSLDSIRHDEVLPYFQHLEFESTLNDRNRNIATFKITDINSFDSSDIPKERGFYIIFSNINYDNNSCTAVFKDNTKIKAIYRGEAHNVNIRLKSHLFNNHHVKECENPFPTTLKIDDSKVNIDEKPYSHYEWYVVYIAAPKSDRNVRNMYEDSFDEVFGRPLYSNEKRRKRSK